MRATDSLKAGLMALVRAALPTVDYYALYRAKVVSQSADRESVDVQPDDKRLPGMSKVPLKLGIPGATVEVAPGCHVLVGWEGGDPQRPHALVWEAGATVTTLTVKAMKLELGAEGLGLLPLVNGVVLASGVDSLTGMTYGALGSASMFVTAKK